MNKHFEKWSDKVIEFHLPRWEELPDVDLYKDQVVTLVERYLSILNINEDKIITPASINNYVKWKLLPKPQSKQYSRTHLSYLIAISALKYIISLQDIKKGIDYKVAEYGEIDAYNRFCESLENSLKEFCIMIRDKKETYSLNDSDISLSMACNALVSKLIAQMYLHFERIK